MSSYEKTKVIILPGIIFGLGEFPFQLSHVNNDEKNRAACKFVDTGEKESVLGV